MLPFAKKKEQGERAENVLGCDGGTPCHNSSFCRVRLGGLGCARRGGGNGVALTDDRDNDRI